MRILKYLIVCMIFVLQSCGGDDAPPVEEIKLGDFNLIYPEKNKKCERGVERSETMVEVPFEWEVSANATSYKLIIENLKTGKITESISTSNSKRISLSKGVQFSWKVIAILEAKSKDSNSKWNFYSEDAQITSHIPFPASISLKDNKDGTINISWNGSDLDNDINVYEIYISDTKIDDLKLVLSTKDNSISNYSITYNKKYLLKVLTKDLKGNTSESIKVFNFKN